MGDFERNKLYYGNCLQVMKEWPDECIQTCITSPPYWNLRDYKLPPQIWDGDPECQHNWVGHATPRRGGKNKSDNLPNFGANVAIQNMSLRNGGHKSQFCQHCGAWRGSLGLEPDPYLYIDHLVQIFREVKRVLRNDGTAWVNIGSSYIGRQMESEEMVLRDDLTIEERIYVFEELAEDAKKS